MTGLSNLCKAKLIWAKKRPKELAICFVKKESPMNSPSKKDNNLQVNICPSSSIFFVKEPSENGMGRGVCKSVLC